MKKIVVTSEQFHTLLEKKKASLYEREQDGKKFLRYESQDGTESIYYHNPTLGIVGMSPESYLPGETPDPVNFTL